MVISKLFQSVMVQGQKDDLNASTLNLYVVTYIYTLNI